MFFLDETDSGVFLIRNTANKDRFYAGREKKTVTDLIERLNESSSGPELSISQNCLLVRWSIEDDFKVEIINVKGNFFDFKSLDARVWAREFCRTHGQVNFEEIIGWFASAITAGFDAAKLPPDEACIIESNRLYSFTQRKTRKE